MKKPIEMTNELFNNILIKYFNNEKIILEDEYFFPFGTNEWTNEVWNSHESCTNGCLYCYSWNKDYENENENRFNYGKLMKRKEVWYKEWEDQENEYIIMYPSKHDITPKIMGDAFFVIKKMLMAKNVIPLIVTKPNIEVIKNFIDFFSEYKDRIMIRLTLTTNNDIEIKYWEPNTSSFIDRLKCIKLLHNNGFNVSVSIEPMLNPITRGTYIESEIDFINSILPYIKSELWIGMMNHVPKNEWHNEPISKKMRKKYDELLENYTDNNIINLVKHFYKDQKVKWKESIKKMMIYIIRNN